MDGITAALVRFDDQQPELHASYTQAYPDQLKADLMQLASPDWYGSLAELLRLDHLVGKAFAEATEGLLSKSDIAHKEIRAIGSHGQTVWHQPTGETPNTLQIGDANLIAEATGLTVVADFRRRDMAAGGQGAPLAPAFHAEIFRGAEDCAVLNLGGIANLTLLPADPDRPVIGFDTGPANLLMDAWAQRYLGQPFDKGGDWARSGNPDMAMLEAMLADPYFAAPPPKSTGREAFNLVWLSRFLRDEEQAPENIQNTLVELTARTVAGALQWFPPVQELIVCGGGVHNQFVMERLADQLSATDVISSAVKGVDPDLVEAIAFAWLARKTLLGEAGSLPSVTGAASSRILGGIYRS